MSDEIYNKHGLFVSTFYGGPNRGRCFQFDREECYPQLTEEELRDFIKILQSELEK